MRRLLLGVAVLLCPIVDAQVMPPMKLYGQVLDEHGAPQAGVPVHAVVENQTVGNATTDDKGWWSLLVNASAGENITLWSVRGWANATFAHGSVARIEFANSSEPPPHAPVPMPRITPSQLPDSHLSVPMQPPVPAGAEIHEVRVPSWSAAIALAAGACLWRKARR